MASTAFCSNSFCSWLCIFLAFSPSLLSWFIMFADSCSILDFSSSSRLHFSWRARMALINDLLCWLPLSLVWCMLELRLLFYLLSNNDSLSIEPLWLMISFAGNVSIRSSGDCEWISSICPSVKFSTEDFLCFPKCGSSLGWWGLNLGDG